MRLILEVGKTETMSTMLQTVGKLNLGTFSGKIDSNFAMHNIDYLA